MTVLSPSQIAAYARAAGFSGSQVVIMTAIAMGESSGRTDITHRNNDGSTDYGIWQINSVHSDILALGDWSNPADNARMAFAVYKKQGYKAWSVYNSDTYREHLTEAMSGAGANATLPPTTTTLPAANAVGGLELLTNPHTYLRLAMFLGGSTLLMIGLFMMGWDNVPDSIKTAANSAVNAQTKAATKGNAAGRAVVKAAKGK